MANDDAEHEEPSGGDFLRSLLVIGILAGLWFLFTENNSSDPRPASSPAAAREAPQYRPLPPRQQPAAPAAPPRGPIYSPETGQLLAPSTETPSSSRSGLEFGAPPLFATPDPSPDSRRPKLRRKGRRSSSRAQLPPTNRQKTVHVKGYYRKDGTYVRPHTRKAPSR